MWEIGFFFLTLSKNTLKYLKHPLWKIWEVWWIPIPFHQPTLSKQLHYIKFMWWEDKNLLTFCWPFIDTGISHITKAISLLDFYIQNLMLQSPKPNVKSSWWVKPWHQFRFPFSGLQSMEVPLGQMRLAFTLHLTWGAFFFFFFFAICYWGLWNQNYFMRTICYEKCMMENERQEAVPYHWVMY